MTFAKVSAAYKDAVHPLLKGKQDMMRRHTGRAHHPDGPDVRRVLQPTDPSQVSSSVCSPRAEKAQNLWFKINIGHELSFLIQP